MELRVGNRLHQHRGGPARPWGFIPTPVCGEIQREFLPQIEACVKGMPGASTVPFPMLLPCSEEAGLLSTAPLDSLLRLVRDTFGHIGTTPVREHRDRQVIGWRLPQDPFTRH